jgi:hypothetical protein
MHNNHDMKLWVTEKNKFDMEKGLQFICNRAIVIA